MERHDMHDFLISSQKHIEEEYARIRRRASEDPGTAGDQGEENWATLLRNWLPSYFQVVTKGRVLFASGHASPQVDVLVLAPAYPKILLDKKLYLAGGVVAAFECKTTLISQHVKKAVVTATEVRRNLPKRLGSPYKELNSTIIFGLLAHSHSWHGSNSDPVGNIQAALFEADCHHVQHPIECLDFLTVSDLATWHILKMGYINPKNFSEDLRVIIEQQFGPKGMAQTIFFCEAINRENQVTHFSPLGVLLLGLYNKLAWMFPDMRPLEEYFRNVGISGTGRGLARPWGLDIFSEQIRERVYNGQYSRGQSFDEWLDVF